MVRTRPRPQPSREPTRAEPRRILHVVSTLVHAGIETWLLNVMRATDRTRHPMDFLVLTDQPGECEDEVRDLGGRVIPCPHPRRPWVVVRRFREVLRTQGPYSVVHSHVHHYSGFIMRLAAAQGVPIRVVHSHNDTRIVEANASLRRRLYLALMKRWIRRYATHRIAVSRSAAEDLFGPDWQSDRRNQIIPCGLDFGEFGAPADQFGVRRRWGLAEDAVVIGHVGRFHWRKNHDFLVEIAADAFDRDPRARLLLVGDGELLPEIQSRVHKLGIAGRVAFTGARTDVAALMRAMDVFVFPSHHEGLGLVLLEAQATGLPCVLAEGLPEETEVVRSLMHRLPLEAPAAQWAALLLKLAAEPRIPSEEALAAVCESDFAIARSLDRLLAVYDSVA